MNPINSKNIFGDRFKNKKIALVPSLVAFFLCLESGGAMFAVAEETPTSRHGKYYTFKMHRLPNRTLVAGIGIKGPPEPPAGFEIERQAVDLPEPNIDLGINILTAPAFNWVMGCSAVSAAMIAGYYDRNGFANIYSGPTNGGIMPLNNSSWPLWTDGYKIYPSCPLISSKKGVDGRTIRGSIEDYWIKYQSAIKDPYITNRWTQHTWGSAIGDFMKTSQSIYGNTDGETTFWYYRSNQKLPCTTMASAGLSDGTLGRKLFYQVRGYTVTECYNQQTDNKISGGFSFTNFKAEINAGRPVLLNLLGHSVVGVGYDDSSNLVYIHDTWDYNNHTMKWGTSYVGMALMSVSIVNIRR